VIAGLLASSLATLVAAVAFRSAPAPVGSKEEAPSLVVAASPSLAPVADDPSTTGGGEMSKLRIWGLSTLYLCYGFSIALQGMVVTPLDAKRLWPESSSLALGVTMALCGLAQVVGPEAGHWSDAWRSRLGRRRPLVLISASGIIALTFLLWLCSVWKWRYAYLGCFLAQQLAWNVLASTHVGLVPDLVPPAQHGFAGGLSAANILVGALVAFFCVIGFSEHDYHVHYALLVLSMLMCTSMVCLVARERSSLDRPADPPSEESYLQQVRERYSLDVSKYPDFALLLLSKTMYCAATVVKGFILYFVADTFRIPGKAGEQALTARVAITAETSAAVTALLTMYVLDGATDGEAGYRTTTRSIIALTVGSLWMGIWWLGPIIVGYGVETHYPEGGQPAVDAWATVMLWGTVAWGAGQGLYLAGDQSLAFALVPEQEKAARYLALNSLCALLGGFVGGLTCGGLLAVLGASPHKGQAYAFEGYIAIFVFASVLGLIIATIGTYMRLRELRAKPLIS